MGRDQNELAKPALHRFADKSYLIDDASSILLQVPESDRIAVLELFKESANTSDFEGWIKDRLVKSKINNPGFFETLLGLRAFVGAFSKTTMEESKLLTEEEIYEHILRNGLFELLLDTTSACNLRCKYCIFSGTYDGFRTYSNENMALEVALKAVDLYFTYLEEGILYNPEREPTIAFYGGEPLLNFALIRSVVDYVKDRYRMRFEPKFTITTNGTLLTDPIIDFLLGNRFSIFVSLDGPEKEHDRNRVFPNGGGTFSVVIGNVKRVMERARKLGIEKERIQMYALATYDMRTDLEKVRRFFDEESPIPLIFMNAVRASGTNYYRQFSISDQETFRKTVNEMRDEFLEYITDNRSDNAQNTFLDIFFGIPAMMNSCRSLISRPSPMRFTETCIPGFKIHVDTKGMLHPCEKSPTRIAIGNVRDGLDLRTIRDILRIYREQALKGCTECSIRRNCGNCISTLGLKGDMEACRNMRQSRLYNLELAMRVHTVNSKYFEERFERYLETVSKIDLR